MLAGQLARAAAPVNAVPNDSLPYWSWDARQLAFQRESPRADNGHVLFSAAGRASIPENAGPPARFQAASTKATAGAPAIDAPHRRGPVIRDAALRHAPVTLLGPAPSLVSAIPRVLN